MNITAWILRLTQKCAENKKYGMKLQVNEIHNAETYWLKQMQMEYCGEEIKSLLEGWPCCEVFENFAVKPILRRGRRASNEISFVN